MSSGSASDWRSFPDQNNSPPEVIFRLPASHGRIVALQDFWTQQGLCLLFLPDADVRRWRDQLEALVAAKGDLGERNATALVVLPGDRQAAGALAGTVSQPPVVLVDEEGRVRQRYLALAPHIAPDAAFLFLLDRWGAPLAVGPATGDWIGEALDWFDLALARCPE